MVRRLAVSLALIASVALTGCVKIESEAPSQEGLIGDVNLVTTMCLSSGSGTCPASGSNRTNAVDEDGGAWQLLVAYRVPANATAPATISATYKAPQTGTVDLAASPS